MKKLNILIVDDEPPARAKLRLLLKKENWIGLLSEAENGVEAITKIEMEHPDLVFLDIQMPGMTGFEVIEAINPERMPNIIFVTAFDEFAIDAFNVDAVDYLLKPYDKPRFQKALHRALKRIDSENSPPINYSNLLSKVHPKKERFLIKEGDRYFFISVKDIITFKSADKYVEIHTIKGKYLVRDTLNHLETCLERNFVRIHRSTIINLHCVVDIHPLSHGDCTINLTNSDAVILSRRYRDRLL